MKEEPDSAGEASGGPPELQGVSFFRTRMDGRDCRMAVVAESEEEALTVIERSRHLTEGGIITPKALRSLAQQGVFMGTEDLPALPLALVFPGQGAHYGGMGRDLYESFPVIKEWMDRAAAVADFDLLHLLFHDREENLQKTRWQQPALFVLEYAIARYLLSLGIHPVATAGHSLGELTALCLAGVYSLEDGFRIVNMRALCMDKAVGMHLDLDPGVMVAVDAPLSLLEELIQGREEDVHISNINSPSQVVLSGKTEAVKNFGDRLKEMGYRATLLRVSMAFHSPIMRVIHDELEAFIAPIPFHAPQIPVISNTTMAPYPSDPGEIRRILMAHLESPVHWMNNVQTLWNDYGVRLFVEVGPGDIMSNLIADTLSDAACIQTCLPGAESLTCKTALAQLFVQGHLKVQREPGFVSLPGIGKAPESYRSPQAPALRPVALGLAGSNPMEGIVQREINRFVLETFGRFLKPNILEAIRQEVNPTFQEDDLASVIQSMLGGSGPPEGRREPPDAVELRINRDSHARSIPPVPPLEKTEAAGSPPFIEGDSGGFPEPGDSPVSMETPAPGDAPESQDHMESLIRIIMDATGFERDEIQPEMDLRKDLSIRSSRLPIIMDAAEQHFGITIELQDFIHVRTVKDIAQKISEIIARQEGAEPRPATRAVDPGTVRDEILKPSEDEASLKRLVFSTVPLDRPASIPMKLEPGESVLLLSPDRDDRIAASVGDIFRLDHGVDIFPLPFLQGSFGPGETGHDIRTAEGARGAADRIAGRTSLAGMVIILPRGEPESLSSMEDVSRLLRGFFILLKTFLQAPDQKIRRADPLRGGHRNTGAAGGGGDAGTISERRAGIPGGPLSHPGNRP